MLTNHTVLKQNHIGIPLSMVKNTQMKIITVILCLFATATATADVWFDIPLASKHINSSTYQTTNNTTEKYNERNPGFGLTTSCTDNTSYMVGIYKNSYKRQSIYAGLNFHTNNEVFNVGVAAGVISGYGLMAIMPMVVPNISINVNPHTKAIIGFIPASVIDSKSSSAITFQVSIKLL